MSVRQQDTTKRGTITRGRLEVSAYHVGARIGVTGEDRQGCFKIRRIQRNCLLFLKEEARASAAAHEDSSEVGRSRCVVPEVDLLIDDGDTRDKVIE